MSHLLLSHLSQNNNTPQLVKDLFNTHADGVEIIIATRHEETGLFHIQNSTCDYKNVKATRITSKQLTLSFG